MIKKLLCSWVFVVVTGEEFKNYAKEGDCGRAFALGFRIVGGEEAKKAEFPWMVSITRRGGHVCGGTLISEEYVLTAAHCLCTGLDDHDFFKPNVMKVTLAQHDMSDTSSGAYKVGVKDIFVHPGYTCSIAKDDIALLKLDKYTKWSENVAPACVSVEQKQEKLEGSSATVAGWGWTNENHDLGKRSDELRKAKVSVINNDECRLWYKEQKKRIEILDSHICAGHKNGGIDACWADSGGPLMKKIDPTDKIMIIGVVSTGRGCGRFQLPGLYTRVSDYITWIDDIFKNEK